MTSHYRSESEQFEKVPVRIFEDADGASRELATEIAALIRAKAACGERAVLGLATGSTPVRLYRLLRQMHAEGLSFANVVTFNLDEYHGIAPSHPESYRRFMGEQLFDHIDIPPENIHIPDGTLERSLVFAHCAQYEKAIEAAGGIDLQILGIGRTGHIGFNEPGSAAESRTRLVTLDSLTRRDAARDFLGESNVPRHALTMGVGTILAARRVVLLAWGGAKAGVVASAVEGPQTAALPASHLQSHANCAFYLDPTASSALTRFSYPWRVGRVDWTPQLRRKAVIHLAGSLQKPVLRLVDEDYGAHHLADLLTAQGPAYNLNIKIFNELQHTLTGWPGGKPNADDSNRPERAEPAQKRCLVLTPEPPDAFNAMGGVLHRLTSQGHEVRLAVLCSGNLGVPDPILKLHLDFAAEMGGASAAEAIAGLDELQRKGEFDLDTLRIRRLKSLVRRGETRAAALACGIDERRISNCELPFYEKGRYRQFQPGEEDVETLARLLADFAPHQIYATGGALDPSSVGAVCFSLLREALSRLTGSAWIDDCRIWLYPPAESAWPLHEVDMAVPLSPSEVGVKLDAIYRHASQRSQNPAPSAPGTEVWQTAQNTNRSTAHDYDALGLAEYEAIETFKRWIPA